MSTRPLTLSRVGLVSLAVVLSGAACASGRTAPTRTADVRPAASARPSTLVMPDGTVAPSTAPDDERTQAAGPSVPTDPAPPRGTPAVTERPGPTPIVGAVQPAPELVDLVRSDGTPFRLADLAGHPTLLFFGYTHCPDVCPATLGELIQVLQARPEARVAFITVDPERDTPEFLAEWTTYLPEGMVGVTGSPSAIRQAADSYGARYARVDTGSAAGYSMSHTAYQYLIDGEGNLVLTYPFGTPAAAIIGDLDTLERAG